MDEVTNPYRPGAGNRPPALIGRDDLLNHFGLTARRALASRPGKSLMPIGLRGVGKTVLLNRFGEIAEGEGFSVVHIEATETGEFQSTLATRLRTVTLELERHGSTEAIRRMLGILKAFSVTAPDGTTWSLDVDPLFGRADSGDPVEDLTDLLVGIGEAARSQRCGFLLLVDEAQYLPETEFAALITAVHRTVQRDLPVVMAGAGLPQLPGRAGEARSYAERLFEFPEVGDLEPDDASAALQIPAQEEGAEFSGEALERIVQEAEGYPYFLQEWGFNVWNQADEAPFTVDDVEQARPEVIRRLDKDFFRVRYDRLTPKEREYLRAMADLGPGPHRSGDIAAQLGVKVESVAPRRAKLISKGMIYSPAHGDTAFSVPLFDQYMMRVMPDLKADVRKAFTFESGSPD